MNKLIFAIALLFISCKSNNDMVFYATNGHNIFTIDNSVSVSRFINKVDSLKCEGFVIVSKSKEINDGSSNKFQMDAKCKFPDKIKFTHHDGIQLPIYNCNGFREYGINLCEEYNLNIKKLSEFYLNPQKRADYPRISKNAILKIVVDEKITFSAIIPTIKKLKYMRDQLDNESLRSIPFLFSLQTIQRDSILIKPPQLKN